MKTERRHELETNALAQNATEWIERIKPYSAQLVGLLVLLLGAWVISSVWNSLSASQDEAAWDAYAQALNSSDAELMNMKRVADDELHAGTEMQEWAYAAWADRQLWIASRQYLSERELALERAKQIQTVYEELAANAGNEQLQNRARFGLARVYELQGNLDQAVAEYDQVRGDLEPIARLYADRLHTPETKKAYEWLAKAELPRRAATGLPGGVPLFDTEMPAADGAGLNVNTLEEILGIGDEKAADERYQADAPAADDTSSDKTPADEAPAAEEAAAAESPASDAPADDAEQP